MLTVRFPNGTSIQYYSAHFAWRTSNGYTDLYATGDKKDWIAQVPNSCVIEAKPPCRVYNALAKEEEIEFLIANMRQLSYSDLGVLARLKKELAKFNGRTRRWKA